MQLLIIDDHAGIRELIADAAKPLACDIRQFASAEEAIAAGPNLNPACVTVDLRMNGMDGIEALRRLRALFPQACLIMVTQFDQPSIRSRALSAGADRFILKEHINDLFGALCRIRQGTPPSRRSPD